MAIPSQLPAFLSDLAARTGAADGVECQADDAAEILRSVYGREPDCLRTAHRNVTAVVLFDATPVFVKYSPDAQSEADKVRALHDVRVETQMPGLFCQAPERQALWLAFEHITGRSCNDRSRTDVHTNAVTLLARIQRVDITSCALPRPDVADEARCLHRRLSRYCLYPTRSIARVLEGGDFKRFMGQGAPHVVSHGDYKPDNLLYEDRAGEVVCRPIDWAQAALRPRWCDIGFLTERHVNDEVEGIYRDTYLAQVLDETHLSCSDADRAFTMGRLWACLRNATGTNDAKERRHSIREIRRIAGSLGKDV